MVQKLYLSCLQKFGLAPCHVFKKVLENENPTAHFVYAKHFCKMLVLYSSTAVLLSQFLVYLKLSVHFHITYYQ